jgi:hypothetical protein
MHPTLPLAHRQRSPSTDHATKLVFPSQAAKSTADERELVVVVGQMASPGPACTPLLC